MFARSEQNDESESSKAAPSGPPSRPEAFCSDQAKSTTTAVGTDDKEADRAEVQRDGCREVAPFLRTPSPPDDDGDSASFFKAVSRAEGSMGISASLPSGGAASGGQ